jgi:adenylate cyclase
LREANVYFEQVIELVPNFSQVYIDHSDLFIHILTDAASDVFGAEKSEEEVATAYAFAIADYDAAGRHALSPELRQLYELDYAFISGNWRGLRGRIERAIQITGCEDGNWLNIIAYAFDYSEELLPFTKRLLACDPRRSLSWFNVTRAAFRAGEEDEALRLARKGTEIAPGSWLSTELVRILVANGQYEQAQREIDDRIVDPELAVMFKALVVAHQGDRASFDIAREEFLESNLSGDYWTIVVSAWGGLRDEANESAGRIDQHAFGAMTLTQLTVWCACGAPFDLEATPNFAAQLEEGNLPWPPKEVMEFPLKDW